MIITKDDIIAFRKKLDISQEAFAIKVGVSTSTIEKWEQGKTFPSRMALTLLNTLEKKVAK